MFGKKKKKKSKARQARAPRPVRQPKRVDAATLERRKRIRHVVLGVVISAAAVLAVIAAAEWLKSQMLKDLPVSRVVVADAPDWLDASAIKEIESDAMEVVGEDPADKNLAQKVAAKLAGNIWIKKLPAGGVINNYDGSLSIRCEYRKPLAIVGSGGVWVRVDREALVLPGRFLRSGVPAGKYREILGVKSNPPAEGQVWTAEDLLAGVNILRLIDGKPFTKEITAIDVSNYRGRLNTYKSHIVMSTEKQSELRWGRAIGTEGRIEVSYEMKLHHLEELFIRYGSLNKLSHADLRGQKVLVSKRNGE